MAMRRCLTIQLVWTLVGPAVALGQAADASASTAAEREIRLLQDQLINAYIHRDVAALEHLLADDYMFVESHGRVLSKAELIDNFGSGDRVLTSYVIDDDRVRVYDNAAVMTYHYRSKERYRGQDQGGDFRFIRVFAKRGDRWRMVAGQETAVTSTSP